MIRESGDPSDASRISAMRIAVVHSFYSSRQSSGENRVVSSQIEALRRRGFTVELFAQRTDEREKLALYPVEAAATVATGYGRSPLNALQNFEPHIVHLHNTFPNFGRKWVQKWDGRLVATMHNVRPLCAAGTFYRDGHVCTECLDRRSGGPAFTNGCYRESRIKSLPLAISTRFDRDPVLERADRILVLSELARSLYLKAGVEAGRMSVVPNFLASEADPGTGGGPWVFVGRLSPEKGVLELLEQWPNDRELLVIGDGPLLGQVRAAAPSSVRLLGQQSAEAVQGYLRGAKGMVFPSRCFEGAPMVYVEALAAGTPVLAWEPSSVALSVAEEGTGLVGGDNLLESLSFAESNFPFMRQHCRATFESKYSEPAWLNVMERLYSSLVM